jgi:hypothetical protein
LKAYLSAPEKTAPYTEYKAKRSRR